jgi:hypothetical protein
MPGAPSGQGWVPPDLQMTEQLKVITGEQAGLLTAPDQPVAAATVPHDADAQVTDAQPVAQPGPTPSNDQSVAMAAAAPPVGPTSPAGPPPSGPSGLSGPSGPPTIPPVSGPQVSGLPASGAPRPSKQQSHRPGVLIAVVSGLVVVGLGAGAAVISQSRTSTGSNAAGSQQGSASPGAQSTSKDQRGRPSGNAVPTAPAVQNGTVPAPRVPTGRLVSYATVQREQGYVEGMLTLVNRTGAPMTRWELRFSYPGGSVKSIWGGVLAQGGPQPVFRNAPNAAPIPAGGTVQVRFGVAGKPSVPQNCSMNGRPC